MNLLKQIEEDKKRILKDVARIKALADKDKQTILDELPKIKEMAKRDITRIKKDTK
jgi:hypothetical protein